MKLRQNKKQKDFEDLKWDKITITRLANQLGLNESQIYKW